jgi:hypothetical protein
MYSYLIEDDKTVKNKNEAPPGLQGIRIQYMYLKSYAYEFRKRARVFGVEGQ